MSENIWESITNYEGFYEVSNCGRVKSLNYNHTVKEGILKPGATTDGYLTVGLWKNAEVTRKYIHRLVAEAFITNPQNKPTVNHINGIKTDNRVENLEWATHKQQSDHAWETGLQVASEKLKLAVAKTGKANQIISTWFNEKLDQEFTGNLHELVRAFPEQKLSCGNLGEVRNGKRKQHKGWKIK